MFENLKKVLLEEFDALKGRDEDITMDAKLQDDLGINSIDIFELAGLCEEKFNVTFEDEDINSFKTIGDVVRYLESHS